MLRNTGIMYLTLSVIDTEQTKDTNAVVQLTISFTRYLALSVDTLNEFNMNYNHDLRLKVTFNIGSDFSSQLMKVFLNKLSKKGQVTAYGKIYQNDKQAEQLPSKTNHDFGLMEYDELVYGNVISYQQDFAKKACFKQVGNCQIYLNIDIKDYYDIITFGSVKVNSIEQLEDGQETVIFFVIFLRNLVLKFNLD